MILVAGLLATESVSLADDDRHENPPPNVASVDEALATVRSLYPGRILKVEFENEDDSPAPWIYEVKVLTGDGRVIEVQLDAVSLRVIEVEGDDKRRSTDD